MQGPEFLECLALLDSVVQEEERSDVAYAYNYECKSSQVEALNDEVSEAYTDSSADSLSPASYRVITSLSDELRTITERHQVSAGSHHSRECAACVESEEYAESHARSVESNADGHESAEDEVNYDSDDQLDASESHICSDLTERTNSENLAEHYCSKDEHSYEHSVSNFLTVELRYNACSEVSACDGSDDHGYECEKIHVYESGEEECLYAYRNCVAYVECTRDVNVVYRLSQLECCSRRSEGTDTQCVEEVSYNTDDDSRDEILRLHTSCPSLLESQTCYRVLLRVRSKLFLLSEHEYYAEYETDERKCFQYNHDKTSL